MRFRIVALVALSGLLAACEGFPRNIFGESGDRNVRRTATNHQDADIEPIQEYMQTTLDELMRNPAAYKGQYVEFHILFNTWGEVIRVPYYTPFTRESHVAFSAWPAGSKIWTEEGRMALHPLFFIARDHIYLPGYDTMETYTRAWIRGIVRSDFDNQPWIEILHLSGDPHPIYTRDSLRDLIRSLDQASLNSPEAVGTIEWTLREHSYPREAEYDLRVALARQYMGHNRFHDAATQYRHALLINDSPALRMEHEHALQMAQRQSTTQRVPETPEPPQDNGDATPDDSDELDQSRARVRELEETLAARERELAGLRSAGTTADDQAMRVQALEAEIADLRAAASADEAAAARIHELENALAEARAASPDDSRVRQLEQENESLRVELQARESLEGRIAELEEQNRALAEQARAERDTLNAEIARLRADRAQPVDAPNETRIQELEAERNTLIAEIDTLRAEPAPLAGLDAALEEREAWIGTLSNETPTEQISTQPASTAALESRIARLESDNSRLTETAAAERGRLQAEIARLNAAPAGDPSDRVREQEELITRLRAEIDRLYREREDLLRDGN